MKTLITAILFLASCGQQAEPTKTPSPEPEKSSIKYSENPKDITVEYRKEGKTLVQVYDKTSEMPECSNSTDSKVSYVRSENKFFRCEDSRWLEVTLNEPEATEVKAAVKASPSPIPTTLPTPEPISASSWYDAIAGKRWILGGKAAYRIAETACGTLYRLPNRTEALAAQVHGVKNAFSGIESYWINELDLAASTTSAYTLEFTPVVAIKSALMTASHSVLCIQAN